MGRHSRQSHRWAAPCLAGVLLGITVLVFGQVATFDFVAYDDQRYVYENEHVQCGLSLAAIRWALTTFHFANWHPLTWLSHMLDCQLFGLDAGWHHLTSLTLHLIATLLLLAFLRQATGSLWRSFGVAFLFAVHPLHVESVAWVSERKDVLAAVFWFLACLTYAWYTRHPNVKRYICVALVFALALMAKPMTVTLPCVFLLLDYWPLQRLAPGSTFLSPAWFRGFWPRLWEKTPLLAMTAISCVLTYQAQQSGNSICTEERLTGWLRLTDPLVNYGAYLLKTFCPFGLTVFYGHFGELGFGVALSCGVLLLLLTAGALRYSARMPFLPVGWFWFLGTLVPVAGFVQIGSQSFSDRYSYLPLVGIFIALLWGVGQLTADRQGDATGERALRRFIVPVGAVLLGVCLAVLAEIQVGFWRNSLTLFSNVVCTHPKLARGYEQLGYALVAAGRLDEAEKALTTAVVLGDAPSAHTGLGCLYGKMGRAAEAIPHFQRALVLKPDDPDALYNMAIAHFRLSHTQDALDQLLRVAGVAPDYPRARYQLALIYASHPDSRFRDGAAALKHARAACELTLWNNPNPVDVLGMAYAELGRFDEALAAVEDAQRLATNRGWGELRSQIAARGELYRRGLPFRSQQ